MTILDFRIFLWEIPQYLNHSENYMDLTFELGSIVDKIFDNGIFLHSTEELFEEINSPNSIPCGENTTDYYPELRDVNSLYSSYLAKIGDLIEYVEIDDSGQIETEPKLTSTDLSHTYNTEIKKIIQEFYNDDINYNCLISHPLIIDTHDELILRTNPNEVIPIFKKQEEVDRILDGLSRFFEPNPKHDSHRPHPHNKGKKVSILECNNERAQFLLHTAVRGATNSNKLYNWDEECDKYLIFIPTRKEEKLYHGYHVKDVSESIKSKLT